VFIGASLAMTVVSLIGVFAGVILVRYVPAEALEKIAAAGFIVIGVLMLWGKL
jgi:putative Ca2+/H+ antiporter (TMEM165/GDT1 family)